MTVASSHLNGTPADINQTRMARKGLGFRRFFRRVKDVYGEKRFQKENSGQTWCSFIYYEVLMFCWVILAFDFGQSASPKEAFAESFDML